MNELSTHYCEDVLLIREKLIDALTPGLCVEFDPDEAQIAGAFIEDAITKEDALDSSWDIEEGSHD